VGEKLAARAAGADNLRSIALLTFHFSAADSFGRAALVLGCCRLNQQVRRKASCLRRLRKAASAALLGTLVLATGCWVKEKPPLRGPLTVLTLLDLQRDYLHATGRMPVAQDQVPGLLKATNHVIAAMQERALPIIYVFNEFNPFEALGDFQRNFAAMRYEPGSVLDPRVNTAAGVYFATGGRDAFANPQFGEHLQLIGAGHLVLAGVHAGLSVLATAEAAKRRGYSVTVISDAVAAVNARTREAVLAKLEHDGIQVETSQQFIASMPADSDSKS